jgi:flagellar basal-body rod protein FlgB
MSTDPIFPLLSRAIDVCALRQSVHAANIANIDVEGYRRMEVSFADELRRADDAAAPQVVLADDQSTRLDQEMALMAKNSIEYQALLSAFERSIGMLRLAVKEGREG